MEGIIEEPNPEFVVAVDENGAIENELNE